MKTLRNSYKMDTNKLQPRTCIAFLDQWNLATITDNNSLQRAVTSVSGLWLDLLNDIHALKNLPKHNMSLVQPWGLPTKQIKKRFYYMSIEECFDKFVLVLMVYQF